MRLAAKTTEDSTQKSLQQILVNIQSLAQDKKNSLVVFDLDSTLFDVSPRLEKILQNFCQIPEIQALFPKEVAALKNVRMLKSDWGIANALERSGVNSLSSEFYARIQKFWLDCFFSNDYLHFDRPFQGATEFVKAVLDAGAEVAYLTGRDRPRMHSGSEEVLKKWGFPLDDSRVCLELKPSEAMDDAEFKTNWFLKIPKMKYEKIWFFENEPLNINLVKKVVPEIEIIFFESTHSGKEQPPEDIKTIFHFSINDDDNE